MLTLIGVDARQWLDEMDRPATTSWGCLGPTASTAGKRTVDQYFLKSNCLVCSAAIRAGNVFCAICVKQPLRSHMIFASRKRNSQQQRDQLLAVCMQCTGTRQPNVALVCESLDCPVFIERTKALRVCAEFDALTPIVHEQQNTVDLSW